MWANVMDVIGWYYKFTQVGAVSQSREDNKPLFKVLWLVAYIAGLFMTVYGLAGFILNIYKYEINTVLEVEKRPFLKFPSVTICNKNRIHCQHLFDLVSECENSSNCTKRRDLYCNLFIFSNCNTTNLDRKGNDLVCEDYQIPQTIMLPDYDYRLSLEKQLMAWYGELSTEEMKRIAHQPNKFIAHCTFDAFASTMCKHYKKFGGTKLFSPVKGVCYSFNLREYFPEELKRSLESIDRSSIERQFENPTSPGLEQWFSGPGQALELVLDVEGRYHVVLRSS